MSSPPNTAPCEKCKRELDLETTFVILCDVPTCLRVACDRCEDMCARVRWRCAEHANTVAGMNTLSTMSSLGC